MFLMIRGEHVCSVGKMTWQVGFIWSVQLIYADIQVITGVQTIILCVQSIF